MSQKIFSPSSIWAHGCFFRDHSYGRRETGSDRQLYHDSKLMPQNIGIWATFNWQCPLRRHLKMAIPNNPVKTPLVSCRVFHYLRVVYLLPASLICMWTEPATGHVIRGMEMNAQRAGEARPFIDTSSVFWRWLLLFKSTNKRFDIQLLLGFYCPWIMVSETAG